jgi:hypothetical protein
VAEFNAIIYRNNSNEFHSIITTLNLRADPVSFYELFGQLITHEILIKSSQECLLLIRLPLLLRQMFLLIIILDLVAIIPIPIAGHILINPRVHARFVAGKITLRRPVDVAISPVKILVLLKLIMCKVSLPFHRLISPLCRKCHGIPTLLLIITLLLILLNHRH